MGELLMTPEVRPFDRKSFIARVRQLTKEFREVRALAEQMWEDMIFCRPYEEVGAERAKRSQTYRDAWEQLRAKHPNGFWPVVFARRTKPPLMEIVEEEPKLAWSDRREAPRGAVQYVPALALDWPMSKPILEIVRPLLIEVQSWWAATELGLGCHFAPGRQRRPPRALLRTIYLNLRYEFRQLLSLKSSERPIDRRSIRDDVIGLLKVFPDVLGRYWRDRVAADWPTEEDVEGVFRVLTEQGRGFGPAAAAFAVLSRALGIGSGERGEESLRKLLYVPTDKARRVPTVRTAGQERLVAQQLGGRSKVDLGRESRGVRSGRSRSQGPRGNSSRRKR